MEKPILRPDFTIEDIHKLREYNYEMTKDMTVEEKVAYYNNSGKEAEREIKRRRALKRLEQLCKKGTVTDYDAELASYRGEKYGK